LSGLSGAELLTGPLATSADLQKSLSRSPQIVHFAVHVVSPPEQPGEAALALSLKNGVPELLTPETNRDLPAAGEPGGVERLFVRSGKDSSRRRTNGPEPRVAPRARQRWWSARGRRPTIPGVFFAFLQPLSGGASTRRQTQIGPVGRTAAWHYNKHS